MFILSGSKSDHRAKDYYIKLKKKIKKKHWQLCSNKRKC